jgi:adenosylcobinamide-phosphate synthase
MTALLMAIAVALDWLLGEPRRWPPLAGFGRLAAWLERRLYAPDRWRGILAVALLLLPPTWLAAELAELPGPWGMAFCTGFSVWTLSFALGHKRLHDQVRPIVAALRAGDETAARAATMRIIRRDAEALEIAPAACESVLESGSDRVFGALFWFLVAGAPGAILYRLANSLDTTWGDKTPRYLEFGWAAANLNEMLGIVPARLTALTYAMQGHIRRALACWRDQAAAWDCPNAGPVIAAGAGALGIRLGGPARYRNEWRERPLLGIGDPPEVDDIERALALVRHGVLLWLVVIGVGAVVWWGLARTSLLLPSLLDILWRHFLA